MDTSNRAPKQYIPDWIRQRVLTRDGHRCRYCGTSVGPFHMDHVYPESKGGETSVGNLVTACGPCNLSKHNRVGLWPKPIGYFDPKPIFTPKASGPAIDWQILFCYLVTLVSAISSVFWMTDDPVSIASMFVCHIALLGATAYFWDYLQNLKEHRQDGVETTEDGSE